MFNKQKNGKFGLSSWCKPCVVEKSRRHRAKDPEHTKAMSHKWYVDNKEQKKAVGYVWRAANPDKVSKIEKRWRSNNKGVVCAAVVRRQAAQIRATPSWLTLEEHRLINDFYRNRPEGYHVDHIIPLRGKNVSGLHVLANLQYLPASENVRKSNKFVA